MRRPTLLRTSLLGFALASSAAFAAAQVASFTFQAASPTTATPVNFTDTTEPSPTSWTWDFGDPASGAANSSNVQNPTHIYSTSGQYTVTLTVTGGSVAQQTITVAPAGAAACDLPTTLCLNNNRFQVTANWTKNTGESGAGTRIKLTDESGYFWFFDPNNVEMVVKVLNGCALNNAYWVFAAGLTNVGVDLEITDTQTGIVYDKKNPVGTAYAPVQDTAAFPTSCP